MKTLFYTTVALLLISFSSCSNRGVNLSNADVKTDNFWVNQSGEIVHRNQRYARMEAKDDKRIEKNKKQINKIAAKEKKKDKRYLAVVPFEFH